MLVRDNPDDYETVVKQHTCEYHKKHPGDRNYPGCTCSGSWSRRKKRAIPERVSHE